MILSPGSYKTSLIFRTLLLLLAMAVNSSPSVKRPLSVNGDIIRHYGNQSIHKQRTGHSKQMRDETAKQPQTKERRLIELMIRMQKKTEEKEHLEHTEEEEKDVDQFFEGDILLTMEQAATILQELSPRRKRKLAEPVAKRWGMPIPFTFDGSHSSAEKHRIKQALAYWESLTCVRFEENPAATNKLLFTRSYGCWSYVGYTHQTNQTVSIGDGCQSNGTIAHEVGHAIGFWHEQSRPDSDEFVLIHKTNVSVGKLYNFIPLTWGEIITFDVPYDLGSVMHYGAKFYAKDTNSTTIETRDRLMARVIGQRQELSFYDVKLANKAYCDNVCRTRGQTLLQPCRRDGYQDPLNCSKCRCPEGFGGDFCQSVAQSVYGYCGGVLDGRYNGTIYSPGYPRPGYPPEIQCNWLIKAPPGSRIYFQFTGEFGVAGHVDLCKDYVEVRYNTSLSLTGPRFCTDDPPRYPLRSHSNEMLILFRSYPESRSCDDSSNSWKCRLLYTGFKAKYYSDSCGGCQHQYTVTQPVCVRSIAYRCAQSWQEQIKNDCPKWWYTPSCGLRSVNRVRYATCYRDEQYCCSDYVLRDGVCVDTRSGKRNNFPHPNMHQNFLSDVVSPRYATPDQNPSPLPQAVPTRPTPVWTEWSKWGTCPRTCGGAVKVRTRRCTSRGLCGANYIQADKAPCAQAPCYRRCLVHKRILCDMWSKCTRAVYEKCKPFCYNGFVLQNGSTCLQNSTASRRGV